MRLTAKAHKEKKLAKESKVKGRLAKVNEKKCAEIKELKRENADLKKKMAVKEKVSQDQGQIIDKLCDLARMNFHAMLEARLELTELRDNP